MWGQRRASRSGYSLLTHEMGGWTTCDFTLFFFFVLFQSYQDDGKKIIIKLCAMELDLYMYYMYQVRGRYLVCVCAGGGGRVWVVSGHQGFDI